MKIAIPTEDHKKLNDRVADTFSRAHTFTFIDIEKGKPGEITVIENTASKHKQGAGPLAARMLKENNVTILITGEVGPGATTILQDFGIKVHKSKIGKKVKDALEEWLDRSN
jgi:predicted Fe-Mo cluster-binding NifX family protein